MKQSSLRFWKRVRAGVPGAILALAGVPVGAGIIPAKTPATRLSTGKAFHSAIKTPKAIRQASKGGELPPPTTIPDVAPTPRPLAPGLIVLFSGQPEEVTRNFYRRGSGDPGTWRVENGVMQVQGGDLVTRENFTDFQLHAEFKIPYLPDNHGQARGNSGIGLQGRYEIQILDSAGYAEPGSGNAGSLYSQIGPLVNATRLPLVWQKYDIVFRAPRFDPKNVMVRAGSVTVWQNGVCVQNNTPVTKMTGIQFGDYGDMTRPGPIDFQDHGYPVEFRNIWVLPLPPQGAQHYEGLTPGGASRK